MGLILLAAMLVCRGLDAQDDSSSTPPVGAAVEQPAPLVVDDVEIAKQKRAMAGLLALCGILVGGLGFVVLVMFWGAQLRRMARRELPAQKTLQNDLWFLKPPKSPPE